MSQVTDDQLGVREAMHRTRAPLIERLEFHAKDCAENDMPIAAAAMREAIQALIDPAGGGEGKAVVKPLEWKKNGTSSIWTEELVLRTYYTIDAAGDGLWEAERHQFMSEAGATRVGAFPDVESAKAAVQRAYEAAIAPALTFPPSSDSEKLIEALTKWFNRLPEVGKSEYDAMVAIVRETSNG